MLLLMEGIHFSSLSLWGNTTALNYYKIASSWKWLKHLISKTIVYDTLNSIWNEHL